MKRVSILGSTGSIGVNTLNVIREHLDKFEVMALAAGQNRELLIEQIKEFKPRLVSIYDERDACEIRREVNSSVEVMSGEEGNIAVATYEGAELIVSAIMGKEAILPTYYAIDKGKRVALAAKEILVSCGEFIMEALRLKGGVIIPIDSEHSAVYQCLIGEDKEDIEKIFLTASGGPFWNLDKDRLKEVSVQEALKHPNWKMGKKITIDSATLMNKGLELIEAKFLFDVSPSKLDVIVHPQSIVHALVQFYDGSIKAQLSIPDMRIPIMYALSFPERFSLNIERLKLSQAERLTFYEPDEDKFPCLRLAKEALNMGHAMPLILNAANDIAVQFFLDESILFLDIPRIIEETMLHYDNKRVKDIFEALELDREAREYVRQLILTKYKR
jgi:1-deoxy-D-xylulose-5-phosphate reductoisomerase